MVSESTARNKHEQKNDRDFEKDCHVNGPQKTQGYFVVSKHLIPPENPLVMGLFPEFLTFFRY
jgi:hypothetical protein